MHGPAPIDVAQSGLAEGDVPANVDALADAVPEVEAPPDAVPDVEAPPDAVPDVEAAADAVPDVEAPRDAVPDVEAAADAVPGTDAPVDAEADAGTPPPAGPDTDAPPARTRKPVTKRQIRREKRRAAKLPGRDPIWARLMVVLGAALVLLASTAITTSRVLAHRYETSLTKQTLLAPEARVTAEPEQRRSTISGPLNYLLIGSDLRANNPEDGQRSDTIIIVHVPASLDRAYLISIPRDLRVRIPAFANTGFRGGREKINGSFQYGGGGAGGVQLLSQTLTNLLGVRFDGAAIIDFGGFQKAVDLLGGVDMCIDVRTESHHVGHDKNGNFLAPWYGPDDAYRNHNSTPQVYEPGCQHLEAWQALDFVRQRKSLADGDYGRQRHQQQFLRAVFDRAQAKDLTGNPLALDRFVRAVGQSLTVDTSGVPIDELMFGLRNVRPGNLLGLQVPSDPEMIGGVSYIVARPEADGLYAALRDDTLDAWALVNPAWVNQI